MEHEFVVPQPVEAVRRALADQASVAGCVPGLTIVPEESSEYELSARLRLRIGGSTITYGGDCGTSERPEGYHPDEEPPGAEEDTGPVFRALLSAEEVRGEGLLTARVRISVHEAPGGTLVRLSGSVEIQGGRLADIHPGVRDATGRRLLQRSAAAFAALLAEPPAPAGDGDEELQEPTATVVYLEDHAAERDLDDDLSDLISFSDAEPPTGPGPGQPYEPEPVLAGPVRRSIVGRSAEEVDHAPPRGRYAPAAPAHSARARAASRWGGVEPTLLSGSAGERSAIPWVIGGGVALLGGAVVLVRALRRR
ncbi:hypothetical protein [Kitasatospora sp. MBT63]|uniref:hypothetical protein n=1 Tax=Kitasatospora sp. MBT63 TaxID=1444768 RepID=UPI000689AF0C|nr:hypothetical protein [Kitasatospora sp. MBT63]